MLHVVWSREVHTNAGYGICKTNNLKVSESEKRENPKKA